VLEIRYGQGRLQDGKTRQCSPVVCLYVFGVQLDGFCCEDEETYSALQRAEWQFRGLLVSATAPPYSSSFIRAIALFPKKTDSRGFSRIACVNNSMASE
jgi:hypothetical protein